MPFDAVIELNALNGTNGFRISGEAELDLSGWSVASAGDINGDGIDDLIIGAPCADPNGSKSGASYVVFGSSAGFAANLNLSDLDGTNGFRIGGVASDDYSGWSVASAGDFNGDGIEDLIIGAMGDANRPLPGASFVVFGKTAPFAGSLNLSALDGTNGFRMSGAAPSDFTGASVASAGDINADGINDLIVGSPGAVTNGVSSGAAYVVFGSTVGFTDNLDLSGLDGTNGFRISGATTGDSAGGTVASAGDINGDGIDDLIVGATGADPNGSNSGASYVIFGRDTVAGGGGFSANLDLSGLDGTNGFRISGVAVNDLSGTSVAAAGDINGDGIDDVLIGAMYADPNGSSSGASYVVFGNSAGFAASLDLSTLDGTNGFRISGVAADDSSGRSVASAGDVNGDGFADLIIGAAKADPNGESSGASYVVFGSDAGFAANLDLSTLDGTRGFQISGGAPYGRSGFSVASAGDIDGDGIDDLIIGVYFEDLIGASYVVFGQADPVIEPGTPGDDSYTGGLGDDQLGGQDGADVLSGLGGDDVLDGGNGKDSLLGGDGADDLVGGAGGDLLDGGTGADAMAGGTGDDTYVVDNIGDVTTEVGGEGSDRVRASITLTLMDNIENLILTGAGDIGGTGNGLNNTLDGNGGANTLNGGAGNDLIRGGAGNDVLNGGTGVDQLLGGIGADDLDGADDNDRLEGGDGNDTILGGTGADILDGGADNDSLAGGTGADQLLGGAGTDTLDGGDGNDILNGGLGADAMTGGAGDDVFLVDDAGDTTIEAAGQGVDQVRAGISVTLGDNIETLILEGVGNLDGTGNSLANTLNGNNGDNILDGAAGNDLLKGGLGADTLIGGIGNDILVGGGGNDSFVVRQASVYSSLIPGGQTLEVDTVSDYATGDRIDLSTIDAIAGGTDDAFTLVGAFDGQLGRMVLTFAGGATTLTLDVDGDRKADYMMRINGNVTADTGGWLL